MRPSRSQAPTDRGKGMMRGKIKFFDARKGYGFIVPEDNSRDVFLHASELGKTGQKNVPEGTELTFDVVTKDKGPSATNVRIV